LSVVEICRQQNISEATFYSWKSKYGGMSVSDAQRLRALEAENAKLKRLVADLTLDKLALQDVIAKKPDARRRAGVRASATSGARAFTTTGSSFDWLQSQDGSLPL